MRDDFQSPLWADRHGDFTAFLGDLFNQTRIAFEHLHAHSYDAPWKSAQPGVGSPSAGCDPKRAA
jgi:hypothetical protein